MTSTELFDGCIGLAYTLAGDWYLPGADRDDVRQEALIGLHDASLAYDESTGIPFHRFAKFVIRRRLAGKLRNATTPKAHAFNNSWRESRDDFGELVEAVSLLPDPHGDASDHVERRERLRAIIDCVQNGLTPLERLAITRRANGENISDKTFDNALHRARKKLAAVSAA